MYGSLYHVSDDKAGPFNISAILETVMYTLATTSLRGYWSVTAS